MEKESRRRHATQVDLTAQIEEAWELLQPNFLVLAFGYFLVLLLGFLSLGILFGPMMAGMAILTLRVVRKDPYPLQIGDIFSGFNFFLHSFLYYLAVLVMVLTAIVAFIMLFIMGMFIPLVGQLIMGAGILLILAIPVFLLFSLYLIVDRDMPFWDAISGSIKLVSRDFWNYLGFTLVVQLLNQIGGWFCFIGLLIVVPLTLLMNAIIYQRLTEQPDFENIIGNPLPKIDGDPAAPPETFYTPDMTPTAPSGPAADGISPEDFHKRPEEGTDVDSSEPPPTSGRP